MKSTKDVKEAMRQYAAMERKLSQSSARLSQRRDERMLAKAGEELRKDPENRQLGDKLKSQKYKDAAQKLKEMKVASKNRKDKKEKFKEQQKRLKKLKSADEQLAEAEQKLREEIEALARQQVMERLTDMITEQELSTFEISSMASTYDRLSMPPPPYSGDTIMPKNPSSAINRVEASTSYSLVSHTNMTTKRKRRKDVRS